MFNSINRSDEIVFRKPVHRDGKSIFDLVENSPPLDLNSLYSYYLLSKHFYDTCLVAEKDGKVVGFVSAYFRPDKPDSLFIWQVVVSNSERGKGLASMMLDCLLARPECRHVSHIETTVNPSNHASMRLFEKYSDARNGELDKSTFLSDDDFEGQDHEEEVLLSICFEQHRQEVRYASL